ncbi:hypothetical protein IFM89_002598 [Coptis chinensis]|uniref:Uncharacterized protein n=1 Tax=Coptis chinensis TaxID=261450 RepID=A0A835HAG0_9MAGN|nr:hypothetical protein IFM89_002598 [Coptis chinensis]
MRKAVLVGLGIVMVLGFSIYLRLWSIDSEFSHEDSELIRRQFDIANKEAMDESAEWRFKYDAEVDRTTKCNKQLIQVKETLQKKLEEVASVNKNVAMLQKENIGLLDRVESLSQELQTEKLKCSLH